MNTITLERKARQLALQDAEAAVGNWRARGEREYFEPPQGFIRYPDGVPRFVEEAVFFVWDSDGNLIRITAQEFKAHDHSGYTRFVVRHIAAVGAA